MRIEREILISPYFIFVYQKINCPCPLAKDKLKIMA
jgi:hypothetical protein